MAYNCEDGRNPLYIASSKFSNANEPNPSYVQDLIIDKENLSASTVVREIAESCEGAVNAVASFECYEDDYFMMWHRNHHGSIDLGLDEKLTSMTGSYSEILDDGHNEDSATELAHIRSQNKSDSEYRLEDSRKNGISMEDMRRGAIPKVVKGPENDAAKPSWNETFEESLSNLARDFSEKSSISSHPSKPGKDCLIRNLNYSPNSPRTLLYSSVPPVDPQTIADLEDQARHIATSMDTLIENLTGTLHSISALSVECVETYRDAVCKTCDAVDSNIKAMYQLMAKCEELSKSMKPVYKLHDQIKEIKRLLDLFESSVYAGGS